MFLLILIKLFSHFQQIRVKKIIKFPASSPLLVSKVSPECGQGVGLLQKLAENHPDVSPINVRIPLQEVWLIFYHICATAKFF